LALNESSWRVVLTGIAGAVATSEIALARMMVNEGLPGGSIPELTFRPEYSQTVKGQASKIGLTIQKPRHYAL
jgi:hypothetical protein